MGSLSLRRASVALAITAAFCVATLHPDRAAADGALAVGLPGNVAKQGFAYGYTTDKDDIQAARAEAMKTCQNPGEHKAPQARALCAIVGTVTNQCVAVALDPLDGTPGVGWAITDDLQTAETQAIAKCEATAGNARHGYCKLDHSRCDGTARASDPWTPCTNREHAPPDTQIGGCTRVIQSGKEQPKQLSVAYSNRGNGYRDKHDLAPALADYNEAIRLDPNNKLAQLGLGNVAFDRNDYDGAIAGFEATLRVDPQYGLAYSNRGLAYSRKGDADHAMADYNEAIRLDPKLAIAYRNRGVAYANKKDYDHAIADDDAGLQLEPKSTDILVNRAIAYAGKNDEEHAMADFNAALRINPNSIFALTRRAFHLEHKGDYAGAIADYDAVTQLTPNDANAWNSSCWARALSGQLDRALSDCNRSLGLRNDANALDSRALVYLKSGQFDKALADYEAVLKLNPKAAGSLYGRGVVKQKTGDAAGADADMAAAKAMRAGIVDEWAKYGVN